MLRKFFGLMFYHKRHCLKEKILTIAAFYLALCKLIKIPALYDVYGKCHKAKAHRPTQHSPENEKI
jgi:hypothetical protein